MTSYVRMAYHGVNNIIHPCQRPLDFEALDFSLPSQ